MTTDLARHIQETPLADTHEHLRREPEWLHDGPDILQDLFDKYVSADLRTAGASPAAMQRLLDASDPDIAGRFRGIEAAWQATRFTGYGEAVRLIAEHLYGLEELSGAAPARRTLPPAARRGESGPGADRRHALAVPAGPLRTRLLPLRSALVFALQRGCRAAPAVRRDRRGSFRPRQPPTCHGDDLRAARAVRDRGQVATRVRAHAAVERAQRWRGRRGAGRGPAAAVRAGRPCNLALPRRLVLGARRGVGDRAPATTRATTGCRRRGSPPETCARCSPSAATPAGPAPRSPTRSRRGAESAARWRRRSPTVPCTSAKQWQ